MSSNFEINHSRVRKIWEEKLNTYDTSMKAICHAYFKIIIYIPVEAGSFFFFFKVNARYKNHIVDISRHPYIT